MHLKLVIDANILIAALIKNDATADLLHTSNLQLYSPVYLLTEVRKYKELIKQKADINDAEFEKLLEVFKRRILFVEDDELLSTYAQAEASSPDEKDTPYIALALKLNIGIWSNDKKLKGQNEVIVYNTEDMVKLQS